MSQQSSIGNLADLKEGEILLPAYMLRQPEGVFVDLSLFPVGGGLAEFLDRLFGEGARFIGLNYRILTGLLYDYDAILDVHGIGAKLKLADDVVAFPAKRKALYRGVKIDGENRRAEYFFEPVNIEVVTEELVYGAPDADGVASITGTARKSELKPTSLDIDEFIAEMWLKGVRFGIDVGAVAGVIARGEMVRMDVALQLDAMPGSDAEIEEASTALRRDNSPKMLANGQADLRKFQNRFPQIGEGERLLKKIPRVLGKPGYKVNGMMLEPELPKDLDLNALAGFGTRVERLDGYEFIVANQDGFLSLDVETNNIAVTEKIENKGGISLKTTGDLSLAGNEFIEHGEVQEGRVVEGKNMTFRSDVYGEIVSQGGFVLLEGNLSNGSAKSIGGDVTSNGRAFNSIIEAWEGRVTVKYAEGCLILGESVLVERAVNCEIIADTVQVVSAEGCGIAGKSVQVKSSDACRGKETVVSLIVPDLTLWDAQVRQVGKAIGDCSKAIEAKDKELAQIKADPETAKFLALATSVKQGTVKLTEAHMDNWKKMSARFAKANSVAEKLSAEKQEQATRMQAFEQELAYLVEARAKSGQGIVCQVAVVAGDTLVRTMTLYNGMSELHKLNAPDIRIRLREQGLPNERVFFNDEGNVDWRFILPEVAPLPA